MSGNVETRSGTTASSIDSAQNSQPLSDPFVAVAARTGSGQEPSLLVEEPEGVSTFYVRRSLRVASSRARSRQPSIPTSSAQNFQVVEALPGGRRRAGYAYQVLESVGEEDTSLFPTAVPTENAGVLRGSTCHSPYHSCRNDRIPPESTGIRWNETGIRRNANQFHRNATGIRWNRYKLPYLGTPLVNNII